MKFKTNQLVCVLTPLFKNIAFFCKNCDGVGIVGAIGVLKCGKCWGKGLRTERMRSLKFGGIGRIQSSFTAAGVTVYTIIIPQIQDKDEHNTIRTRDVSMAYWNQVEKTGTAYNTITTQVPEHHVFESYIEAMKMLPAEKRIYIEKEISKLGGLTMVFQEDPEKVETTAQLRRSEKAGVLKKGDIVTSVVYRSSVLRYFKCTNCDGSNKNCPTCYGGGKDAVYVPQYIVEGVVKITKVVNSFCEYHYAPIPYVDDKSHVMATHNYWISREKGTDNRAPRESSGLREHLFTTSTSALAWIERENAQLLRDYSRNHGRTPYGWMGEPVSANLIADVDKFPKAVAIEACLR